MHTIGGIPWRPQEDVMARESGSLVMPLRAGGLGREIRVLLGVAVGAGLLVPAASPAAPPEPAGTDTTWARVEELYAGYREAFPEVVDITVPVLVAMRETTTVVLVDVRSREEQAVSMIPGAITRKEFEDSADEYRGTTVVAYCTIGYRSGRYTRELQKKGWNAYNLRGSVLAWAHAGLPFVNAEGETRAVHVYGALWNLLPPEYVATW